MAENLIFGRLAFNGANPEIEKMMENRRLRAEEAEEARREKDVQDEEMAAHYGNLKGTVAKKFATKRAHGGEGQAGASVFSPRDFKDLPMVPENPAAAAEFLEKGVRMVESMRKNTDKWGRGGKRKKFMKPTE